MIPMRRHQRFRARVKGLSINRMIPNILTILALCAGMSAIRFALLGQWQHAVIAIIVAGIFDGLDGRVARLIGGTSKFGAELDSLSDFVSFGVAPGTVIYMWCLHGVVDIGWAAALFFATCSALRLARFNTMIGEENPPPYKSSFFTGVPAPAGAGLAIIPLMASFQFGSGFFDTAFLNIVWLVAVGLLMVSTIPTFSMKKVKVPHKLVLPSLLVVGVLTAGLVADPWPTVLTVVVVYLLSIPFSIRAHRRMREEWAEMAPPPAGVPEPVPVSPPPASGP
ncbi:MAG: CDP-diacylglycerol--serine O-phosphatidyltransferase [Alphaproteobacteria bacterium]|nr:CDP-diacylglycerol--serine O-phosphatidyltransferase [Alphaproteobacteria bacterium]